MRITRLAPAVLVILLLAGCGRTPESPAEDANGTLETPTGPTATVEAAAESSPAADAPGDATISPNEGLPVEDLTDKAKAGPNPTRADLLALAHSATGIADDFYVWQLYRQGTSAVGDLQGSRSGKRTLVAFELTDGEWKAVYEHTFIDASRAALREAVPGVTAELADGLEFVVPVPTDFYSEVDLVRLYRAESGGYTDEQVLSTLTYAPTRMPEGFAMRDRDFSGGTSYVEYAKGESVLIYYPLAIWDYQESDSPDKDYTNLRFGDRTATMDRSYGAGREGVGPELISDRGGYQVISATNVSPGMVAAVAESMVRVK